MKQESNFLSKLSDTWLVALLCLVVPGMFSTGFYLGTEKYDKESVEIRQENKFLRDSIGTAKEAMLHATNDASAKVAKQTN